MIGEQRKCENPGCEEVFIKKTHNQIYHEPKCTLLATNIKVMEKYYARQARRLGKVRYCEVCGITRLSRYNPDAVCNSCTQRQEIERNQSVSNSLASVLFTS